jgi:hypothetical protein
MKIISCERVGRGKTNMLWRNVKRRNLKNHGVRVRTDNEYFGYRVKKVVTVD